MAIKAYNSNVGNSVIDTSVRFLEGDMLRFDSNKNLFVRTSLQDFTNIDFSSYASRDYVDGRFASITDNDRQSLSLVGNTLSIQNGNSVDLSTILQNLSLTGTVLSISEGNQIDIGPIIEETIENVVPNIDLSNYVTESELTTALANYQPSIDLADYYTKTEVNALIPTVFSGDYNDLDNKPDIPSLAGYATQAYVDAIDLSNYVTESELTTALAGYQPTVDLTSYYTKTEVNALIPTVFSGDYNDLDNKPDIPSLAGYATQAYVDAAVADMTSTFTSNLNDLNDVAIDTTLEASHQALMYNGVTGLWENKDLADAFATKSYITDQLANIVSNGQINLDGYATESYVQQALLERGPHFSGNYYDLNNRPTLFSGSYNDLTNKPLPKSYIFTIDGSMLNLVETTATPDIVVSSIDMNDFGIAFSGDYNDLTNTPILFSGNYNDLSNKPYIPSIAGLATETYVNNKHAEPNIWGDKTFKGSVTFESFTLQKVSTVSHTAAVKNMVMAIQTTNAVPTEVLLSTGGAIAVASGTTAMFKITFVATSGTDAASFIVRGIVDNNGSGVRLIGGNVTETIADSDQTWTGVATANILNDSLKIVVTGSDATTVDWTIFAELSEVIR